MVLRRCRKLLGDEERALQAMQDTFVKLIENEERLESTYPSSLMYRIATNVCLNIIRSEKKTEDFNDNEALLHEIALFGNQEQEALHKIILNKIFIHEKESTEQIAVMFYLDGMTHNEIANELGMSVSGVRKRLRNLSKKARSLREVS